MAAPGEMHGTVSATWRQTMATVIGTVFPMTAREIVRILTRRSCRWSGQDGAENRAGFKDGRGSSATNWMEMDRQMEVACAG